jgi:hypothetical protein
VWETWGDPKCVLLTKARWELQVIFLEEFRAALEFSSAEVSRRIFHVAIKIMVINIT